VHAAVFLQDYSCCVFFASIARRMVRDVCAIQGAWLPTLAPHFFHSRVQADAAKRARVQAPARDADSF